MGAETQRQSGVRCKTWSLRLTALFAAGCLVLGCQKDGVRSEYQPRAVPPVSSTQLTATVIVPTLDTPLAKSGNAVWCATFQVAWNHARDDVLRGPLRVANAQAVANRLNNSTVTEAALPPGSYYAAAGRLQDGTVETIRREMARRFPGVAVPDFDGAAGFVAYGYLNTKTTFTTPFLDTNAPIEFRDAAGVKHSVKGFGPQPGSDWKLRQKQAAQVRVLFSQNDKEIDSESHTFKPAAFALDLTADQAEHQVIVAILPRPEHLHAALDELTKRIEKFAPAGYQDGVEADVMAIPNIAFHVNHEFAELQGVDKIIENPGEFRGLSILKASQSILFHLDKSGVTLVSESHVTAGSSIPRDFVVDRPFLIVMKRRSSAKPFFVAWIDNPELLELSPAVAPSGP